MAVPNNTKLLLFDGSLDLANDDIRVALMDDTTAYSFNPDSHSYLSDVFDGGTTGSEMSGTGYSRKALSTKTTSADNTDDEAVFDAADVTWTGLDAGTIQAIVVYKAVDTSDTGTAPNDSASPIIDMLDDAAVADLPLTTNGSDVTISWAAEGILNLG